MPLRCFSTGYFTKEQSAMNTGRIKIIANVFRTHFNEKSFEALTIHSTALCRKNHCLTQACAAPSTICSVPQGPFHSPNLHSSSQCHWQWSPAAPLSLPHRLRGHSNFMWMFQNIYLLSCCWFLKYKQSLNGHPFMRNSYPRITRNAIGLQRKCL